MRLDVQYRNEAAHEPVPAITSAGLRSGRPRIVMVSANAYPVMGGVETHLHEVAPRLVRDGFDVTVLTTDRSGGLPPREENEGVQIRRVRAWPAKRDYYFAPGLIPEINRSWDLLHCHGYQTLVPPIALLAASRARLPYVVTLHSGGHRSLLRTRLRWAQQWALRPLLARAKRIIAVSQFEAALFARRLQIPSSHVVTIPNGAELAWPPGINPADEDPALILSIGRLERYKGHHRAIEALPYVIREVPTARLKIVGMGPYEAELRRLVHESGLDGRVEIGSIDPKDRGQMAAVVASAGLVTLLSEYEANPVSVMEALALRRRVLVADTSGLSELTRGGMASAVPLGSSPQAIARAMVDALRSPAPPSVDLPTWDDCAARIARVYRSVLSTHRDARPAEQGP